jgi:DNA-binding transcriptional MerR regulator
MKIGEVSQKTEISIDTLRYYEKVGLIPTISRNGHGVRDYSEADLRWIDFIKRMRGAGLPIDVLTEYVDLVVQGDATIEARKAILKEQRELLGERIKEMQLTILYLDYKIRIYEGEVLKAERDLGQVTELEAEAIPETSFS